MSTPDILSPYQSPYLASTTGPSLFPSSSPILPPVSSQKRSIFESPGDDPPTKKQKNDSRGTRLLSHAIRQSVGKFPTSAERRAAAFDTAQSLDDSLQLPVDSTVVNLREAPCSSQSEQFEHTNN